MDVTLLYNGYNVQRRKMYTLSPRHNLKSQVDIQWPDSLHHEQLSPSSKLRSRQSIENHTLAQHHNSFVDRYLTNELNLKDSRLKKIQHAANYQRNHSQGINRVSASYNPSLEKERQSLEFKLPKIVKEECEQRKSLLSEIIGDRPRSYFSTILSERLKKYSHKD